MTSKHLTCICMVLAAGCRLGASTLPDVSYSIILSSVAGGATFTAAGSYSLGGFSASAAPAPSPTVHASSSGDGGASVDMTYFISILGAPDFTTIPIDITGSMWTAASQGLSDNSSSTAELTVTTALDQAGVEAQSATGGSGRQATWAGTLHVNLLTGDQYANTVHLVIEAGENQGAAEGMVDPFISIDPSFDNSAGYTVSVSPGVGNDVAGAPEPASWALVSLALCGAILLRSRSRIQTSL